VAQDSGTSGQNANAQSLTLNPIDVQGNTAGTTGYIANSTSVATKTNTPLINIPQSLTVITKDFIKDQSFQSLTDVTRYVPGVDVHQGEGNRDELVIRGVDSSANFYVDGFRDDVQYFRDLYNTQSIEILKGPSALTFGRGSGGGLLNRTLKQADGDRIYDFTAQTGSFADRRFTVDAGQAVNDKFAVRLNMMYEGSDTFRDFGTLERYGVNPTFTYKVDDYTKLRFSYEHFHDDRTADRGNPSQATLPGGSTKLIPGFPFAPGGDLNAFYGSPSLNDARVAVDSTEASIEHDFQNGLTVKNATRYANYLKFYQNVYPGNGPLSGAVNPADTAFNRAAYQHWTNRDDLFNDTDFVYKGWTGPLFHTVAFGTEFVREAGIDLRNTGVFPNGTTTTVDSPFSATYFGPVSFVHMPTDSNSKYRLYTESAYARDTIEVTRWLQLLGGARFDRFDLKAVDQNTTTNRARVDDKVSPFGAVIVKPVDNLSLYYAYSISYLPASGDQFSSLSATTVLLAPQKFVNNEIGAKWNITPKLLYTLAAYNLDRTNVPVTDPNNPALPLLTGSNRIRGIETSVTGYITEDWQSTLGYAYTDARVTSNTGTSGVPITAGNRVQLVPYNQFSWWNKYQIDPVWSAAVGFVYFSDSYATSDDTVSLPGWFRVDAAIFAKIDNTWRLQFNVENVFNKGYWASADGNNNISPGAPRTFRVSATASF
jgi:catecholate siderophore receptor